MNALVKMNELGIGIPDPVRAAIAALPEGIVILRLGDGLAQYAYRADWMLEIRCPKGALARTKDRPIAPRFPSQWAQHSAWTSAADTLQTWASVLRMTAARPEDAAIEARIIGDETSDTIVVTGMLGNAQ